MFWQTKPTLCSDSISFKTSHDSWLLLKCPQLIKQPKKFSRSFLLMSEEEDLYTYTVYVHVVVWTLLNVSYKHKFALTLYIAFHASSSGSSFLMMNLTRKTNNLFWLFQLQQSSLFKEDTCWERVVCVCVWDKNSNNQKGTQRELQTKEHV